MAKRSTRSDLLVNPNGIQQKSKEDLQLDYLEAKQKFAQAKKEREAAELEFQVISDKLFTTEKQTIALANSIGGDSIKSVDHAALKEQVYTLEEAVNFRTFELEKLKRRSSFVRLNALEKAFNDQFINVEKLANDIEGNTKIKEYEFQEYLKELVEQGYQDAFWENMQNEALGVHVAKLHAKTRTEFRKANYPMKKKSDEKISEEKRKEFAPLIDKKIKLELTLADLENDYEFSQTERDFYLMTLFDEIERINNVLANEDKIDMAETTKPYFPNGLPQQSSPDLDSKLIQIKIGENPPVLSPLSLMGEELPEDADVLAEKDKKEEEENEQRLQNEKNKGFPETLTSEEGSSEKEEKKSKDKSEPLFGDVHEDFASPGHEDEQQQQSKSEPKAEDSNSDDALHVKEKMVDLDNQSQGAESENRQISEDAQQSSQRDQQSSEQPQQTSQREQQSSEEAQQSSEKAQPTSDEPQQTSEVPPAEQSSSSFLNIQDEIVATNTL